MTRTQLVRMVAASRHDTTMARAFRRALNLTAPKPGRKRHKRRGGRFKGVAHCQHNTSSPMDW